jgi:hypothetical protein
MDIGSQSARTDWIYLFWLMADEVSESDPKFSMVLIFYASFPFMIIKSWMGNPR